MKSQKSMIVKRAMYGRFGTQVGDVGGDDKEANEGHTGDKQNAAAKESPNQLKLDEL